MKEAKHQSKIIKKYESEGWYVIRLIQTNKNGIPDLLMLKSNEIKFVEVKAEKGKLSELQKFRIKELRDKNFNVEVSYARSSTK